MNYQPEKSIWGLIKKSLDEGQVIKVENYQAEEGGKAAVRVETGQTVSSTKKGFTKYSPKKTVGNSRMNVLLSTLDTGSRNEEGEYDYRTVIVASLNPFNPNKQVKKIHITHPFESYKEVNLENLPIFPELAIDDEEVFIELLMERTILLAKIDIVKKDITNIKSKIRRKDIDVKRVEDSFGLVYWKKPEGTTDSVVNENGQPVKKEKSVYPNGGKLELVNELELNIRRLKDVNDLPMLYQMKDDYKNRIEEINSEIRAFECGLIERNLVHHKIIEVGGVKLKVVLFNTYKYDFPKGTKEKLKSKKWGIKKTAQVKGRWVFVPAEIETGEEETVTV